MKRRFALLALCGFALVCVPGCDGGKLLPPTDPVKLAEWIKKNKVTIVEFVRMGAEFGTDKGLTAGRRKIRQELRKLLWLFRRISMSRSFPISRTVRSC